MDSPDSDQPARPTAYELLGGDAAVKALVERFYDLMDLDGAYAALRQAHPPDLASARDKLYWFLSGWLGGPNLYIEQFGHPRLRARHMPFSIGILERDQWLACMAQAMTELSVHPELKARLEQAFFQTADWMVNRAAVVKKMP